MPRAALLLALAVLAAAVERPRADVIDLAYGPDRRQVIDLWHAEGAGPAPLCLYFHGGGFTGGDKAELRAEQILALRRAGFAVASANYRFGAMPLPLQDGARALQFLRAHAGEHGIDPQRVAVAGGSAGAVMSLWLGFHDDLASAAGDDPVVRASTRVKAVGSLNGQSSLDPVDLRAWFGPVVELSTPQFLRLFGFTDRAQADAPAGRKLIGECSPIAWLTADDPPVLLQQDQADGPLTPQSVIHSPIFGRKLAERMQALKIEVEYHGHSSDPKEAADLAAFLWKNVNR